MGYLKLPAVGKSQWNLVFKVKNDSKNLWKGQDYRPSLAIGYCDSPYPVSVSLSSPVDIAETLQKQYGMNLIHILCS